MTNMVIHTIGHSLTKKSKKILENFNEPVLIAWYMSWVLVLEFYIRIPTEYVDS